MGSYKSYYKSSGFIGYIGFIGFRVYKWGYKSSIMGYNYSYPTCKPTYNYP